MKKAIIFIIFPLVLMTGSAAGYLYYDWQIKTDIGDEERYIYMYSWTDKQGQVHLSDKTPPENAQNIKTIQGLKQLEEPVIVQIKESVSEFLNRSREGSAVMAESKQENIQSPSSSSVNRKRNNISATRKIERKTLSKKRKGKT